MLEVVVRYRDEQGVEGEFRFGPEDRVDVIAVGEAACARLGAFSRALRVGDGAGVVDPAEGGGAAVRAGGGSGGDDPGPVCWHTADCAWICA